MTSDELNAIKARNAARTPGQWVAFQYEATGSNDWHGKAMVAGLPIKSVDHSPCFTVEDGIFIASCSEDVPALIAEVEQLKALLTLAYHAIYLSSNGLARANLKNDIEAVLEDHNER